MDAGSVDDFIPEQHNKSTAQKAQRDLKLLELVFVNENEERNIKDIPTEELNEYVYNFIVWFITKDEKEYVPSSLRNLLASFQQNRNKDSDDEFKHFCKHLIDFEVYFKYVLLILYLPKFANALLCCENKIVYLDLCSVDFYTTRHWVGSLTIQLNKTVKI